tara:strand:- start:249 stop:380 length:132 start_codon:yes stop_codon:yes gene_type:complete
MKKCKLIIHGKSREINQGDFKSITAAKKYARECIIQPITIKTL